MPICLLDEGRRRAEEYEAQNIAWSKAGRRHRRRRPAFPFLGADVCTSAAVVFAGGEGEQLCQRRRFLALGDEQLDKVRLERKQLLGDPLDLGRVVFVLKQ